MILDRALRDRRVALTWWMVGVLVYTGFIVAVWPVVDGNEDFQDLYDDMPEAVQAMFGVAAALVAAGVALFERHDLS